MTTLHRDDSEGPAHVGPCRYVPCRDHPVPTMSKARPPLPPFEIGPDARCPRCGGHTFDTWGLTGERQPYTAKDAETWGSAEWDGATSETLYVECADCGAILQDETVLEHFEPELCDALDAVLAAALTGDALGALCKLVRVRSAYEEARTRQARTEPVTFEPTEGGTPS